MKNLLEQIFNILPLQYKTHFGICCAILVLLTLFFTVIGQGAEAIQSVISLLTK